MSTQYENTYVLNVLSDDHPGIVAAVGHAIDGLAIDGGGDTLSGIHNGLLPRGAAVSRAALTVDPVSCARRQSAGRNRVG